MVRQSAYSVRRWNAKLALEVLEEFEDSGLSMAAFARLHRLCPQRIRWWRTQLHGPKHAAERDEPVQSFVELVLAPSPPAGDPQKLCIRCPTGHTIELVGPDAERALDILLRTLGGL